MDDQAVRARVARIEELLGLLEDRSDDTALEAVRALLELYGEGLARVLRHVPDPAACTRDELVAHLLELHGLRPAAPQAFIPLTALGVRA
ncbi:hypothetical protein DPM19_07970 [Actinomadura craniellae]|uniref:Uncharacterized protein n=1 Tax=Actinomadura craniellae TaxID=2231787 RepID=A0A365H995_9ACTN|nr:hypothetical protein [Actinomadura craniellae]RAY15710.1 hypothetical protein DPM19_07970 [Actinomadura craniellae]